MHAKGSRLGFVVFSSRPLSQSGPQRADDNTGSKFAVLLMQTHATTLVVFHFELVARELVKIK